MARSKIKWCICFSYTLLFSHFITSLPTKSISSNVKESNNKLENVFSYVSNSAQNTSFEEISDQIDLVEQRKLLNETNVPKNSDVSPLLRSSLRPGLTIRHYTLDLTVSGNSFNGRLLFHCSVTSETRDRPLLLHMNDLRVTSVRTSISDIENAAPANFNSNNVRLQITPSRISTNYIVIIEYSGNLRSDGRGLYRGSDDYIAMNLYPTNARRVFPCLDEPTQNSEITVTLNGAEYGNLISNINPLENEPNTFTSLVGAPARLALIGHDFRSYNVPVSNVLLSGRPDLSGQENQASIAINSFFNFFNEWTEKPYFEILQNQANNMQIVALPDVDVEWHSLSIVGLWEPYLFMENQQFSVKQKQVALIKIAEAMARPWFGFTILPQNWIFQWLITGLQTYAAYEAVKELESGAEAVLDYDTMFVTEIIQESLYRDGYSSASILEPDDFLENEGDIRNYMHHGLLKYKGPAIMSMLRHTLGEETDYVQYGAQRLLLTRSLFGIDTVNTENFFENVEGEWDGDQFDNLGEFLEPYIKGRGTPLLIVNYQSNLVTISRSTFNYAGVGTGANFFIPLTYTTSVNPDFDNVYPSSVYQEPTTMDLHIDLDEEEWILFNIQGKGYYRVQYNAELWERIIWALENPDRRQQIHPLNRASLVDDSLNLARRLVSGLNYDIPLRIVLTMEHETEYAVWRAFLRNMNFLRKRLEAMVQNDDDEELDRDIYVRMVRRTIHSVEQQLGFRPDINLIEPPMDTLTRAMVMDHACRVGYDPCIAAAIDWFYGADNSVNPNIPRDLRPAVYCTAVHEGGENEREMLFDLLESSETRTMYDRVVILESLACSQDGDFIHSYLLDTVSDESPYSVAERSRIFAAVVESSYSNSNLAFAFLRDHTDGIRQHYGGTAKLEELIYLIANNIVNHDMEGDYRLWLDIGNSLHESEDVAREALLIANENLDWNDRHLQHVYDWINENDATTAAVSMVLLCITVFITIYN